MCNNHDVSFALPVKECRRCVLGVAAAPASCPFIHEKCEADRHLALRGAPIEKVVFVRSGYVSLAPGPATASVLRGPGAVVGLECLMPSAQTHTVTTLTDTELCTLQQGDFRRFCADRPGAVASLLLAELAQRDVEAGFRSGPAHARVARFLLERLRKGGGAYPLPFRSQVLARLLSLRPKALQLVIERFRREGVLAEGGGMRVRDAHALAEYAAGKLACDHAITPRT